ncbi:diguanylate cyclase [Sinorhizobium fredii USDA 205]|nr:diguanylate cyclase [Sinorhizobium fredii USDA 205]GEC30180.1 bifunctional diguanylate cyclase/phosphodiesterase [Sinorhizobium fredii]GLS10025.1 bifunctional diguanylate cyclase/phosphodiesterase [Sinorhizobium fredii]
MSSNSADRRTQAQTSVIVTVTICFVVIALLLTGLMAHVVVTMTRSANKIDDARAGHAAQIALAAFASRLSATVTDNAVWDEAYEAVGSVAAEDWAYDNWGSTSKDYALYDGAILTGPTGTIVSAYRKGEPFEPRAYFGEAFNRQIQTAGKPGQSPLLSFFKTEDGVALVGSEAVQPYQTSASVSRFSVLTFYKLLTPEVIATLSSEHGLDGLRLQDGPPPGLAWPSAAPGSVVFNEVYPYVASAAAILVVFLGGVLFVGASEARRLHRLAETARFQANHDSLSGLLNRHGLLDFLERSEPSASSMLSLYLIDLDGFKAVNDAWGHAVGDALIRLFAKALPACHPEIVAAARLGGDEFAMVQVGPAPHGEIERAILALLVEPFKIDDRTIEVGASIGTAVRTDDIASLELLRRADMALYRAKENGKGQAVQYDLELDRERQHIAELEGKLRSAISTGLIEPAFQPLVSAATGEIIGVEALARWPSPAGNISPEIFIPLAEKSGLIDALGVHMLRTSVRHAKDWSGLALSVNVSPIQLCNPDFAAQVIAVLKEFDFDPSRLTLEITESVLMTSPDQARRSIDHLKCSGIKFALDDFGCGYASIGALRQFGFDRMKIDRSLVSGVENAVNGIEVLRATISLATALDIPVTAEGIENARQAAILRETGCD